MKNPLKKDEKLALLEQIVDADYSNGRTLKRRLLQKIAAKGKCPFLFCKELTRLKETV